MALQISQSELNDYVSGQKAKNTVYKEKSTINIFSRFCFSINERRDIHEFSAQEEGGVIYTVNEYNIISLISLHLKYFPQKRITLLRRAILFFWAIFLCTN